MQEYHNSTYYVSGIDSSCVTPLTPPWISPIPERQDSRNSTTEKKESVFLSKKMK